MGFIHCSGGGQTKILHFVGNLHVIKDNLFPVPPLFRLVQEESGTPWHEMYKVFNMGHRLEFYVPEQIAQTIINFASEFRIGAQIIGYCEPASVKKLTIQSEFGDFFY